MTQQFAHWFRNDSKGTTMKPANRLCLVLLLIFVAGGCERELTGSPEPTKGVVITSVSVSPTCVQGDTIPVVVTVENRGDQKHTFEVILTDITDGKEIGRKAVTLSANDWRKTDADLILAGESPGRQNFGNYVFHGDVNGDGCQDLLITASNYDDNRGRAYLYYGGPNMDANADKIFTGENQGDLFGERGSYLSDLNNDGFDEVIMGALKYNDGEGRVYIYYGGTDMDEEADLVLDAVDKKSKFGSGIATGDVNNDGYDDLFVGARGYQNYTGRVYLYYGGDPFDTTADKTFTGEDADDAFGMFLSARGDVDGDNCNDLLVGSLRWWYRTKEGRAYLYYGSPHTEMDESPSLIFADKEGAASDYCHSVDLFDIDNDGHADVMVGARKWPGDGTFQGRAYLYWGSSRVTMDNFADVIFTGEADAQATFGGNSVYAGYVNDDPYGDVIISAFGYYRSSMQGRAYLFYGSTKTSMDVVCDRTFDEDVPPVSNYGKEAKLCDLNNDGLGDVVLGAYTYNNQQGRVYIYCSVSSSSTEVKFSWDTTNVSTGNHILKMKVNPVTREGDLVSTAKAITVGVKPTASGKKREPVEEQAQKSSRKSTALQETATPPAKKPTTSITVAAVDGDIHQVRLHLAGGTDINEKTISGDTALHYAIKYRHKEVAELLITKGADINSRNRDSETPAHLAIKTNHREVLDLLITKDASISPVHLAAYKGDLGTVRNAVSKKRSVNATDEGGLTLLHAAASGGQKGMVEYLLSQGAQVNVYDEKKQTPLFCAALTGHREMVRLLLAKGADPNPARDPDHWTPLYAAVDTGHKDVVELLANNGGNVNTKAITGDTPLHVATLKDDKDIAGLLILKGADHEATNARYGNTPLHLAVVAGYKDIVELLAAQRANLDIKNADGFTPLHYAVSTRRLSWWEGRIHKSSTPNDLMITQLLIAHAADVNAKSDNGATPLGLARNGTNLEIVELLKKHGAKE